MDYILQLFLVFYQDGIEMKKKSEKILLMVHPIYTIIIWIASLFIFIALLIFPNIFWKTNEQLAWKIVYNVGFAIIACLCIFKIINLMQIAIISDEGILIKNPFRTLTNTKWTSIIEVNIENLVTYNSKGIILIKWIVFKTSISQNAEMGGINKKNKGPWQIKASNKNLKYIKEFSNKYAKNATIKID